MPLAFPRIPWILSVLTPHTVATQSMHSIGIDAAPKYGPITLQIDSNGTHPHEPEQAVLTL